jgi:L-threonylcarbamoyladenylate synthase
VSRRYDCTNSEQRAAGVADAVSAIRAGELVVIPTDTVYGIGADAFTPLAVAALLEAKGRGRDMPVPVLVGTVRAASALVEDLGTYGQDLIDSFWPGPLTLICRASRSLSWDLGDSKGTVAIRMPLHAVALELLKETGPMAVSSANRTGAPPATTAADAEEQLAESVAVYLDGGPCSDSTPSTIIDLTTPVPRVLRQGAIPVEKLRSVVGYVATDVDPAPEADTGESTPTDVPDQVDKPDEDLVTEKLGEPGHDLDAHQADDIDLLEKADKPGTAEPADKVETFGPPEPADKVETPGTPEPADKLETPGTAEPADKTAQPVDKAGGVNGVGSASPGGSGTADAPKKADGV